MFAPFIEFKMKPLLKEKITVTRPQGKLELEDGYSPVELAKLANAPSDDEIHYRKYLSRIKAKFGVSKLELVDEPIKEKTKTLEDAQIESARLEARGSTLHNKVVEMPNGKMARLWFSVRY